MSTNDLCYFELLDVELLDYLTVYKQMTDVLLNCYKYVTMLGMCIVEQNYKC